MYICIFTLYRHTHTYVYIYIYKDLKQYTTYIYNTCKYIYVYTHVTYTYACILYLYQVQIQTTIDLNRRFLCIFPLSCQVVSTAWLGRQREHINIDSVVASDLAIVGNQWRYDIIFMGYITFYLPDLLLKYHEPCSYWSSFN